MIGIHMVDPVSISISLSHTLQFVGKWQTDLRSTNNKVDWGTYQLKGSDEVNKVLVIFVCLFGFMAYQPL